VAWQYRASPTIGWANFSGRLRDLKAFWFERIQCFGSLVRQYSPDSQRACRYKNVFEPKGRIRHITRIDTPKSWHQIMATPFRELRPAPLADGQESVSLSTVASRSRNRASLACQPCREKRRKVCSVADNITPEMHG
jgi:hypothetical protein